MPLISSTSRSAPKGEFWGLSRAQRGYQRKRWRLHAFFHATTFIKGPLHVCTLWGAGDQMVNECGPCLWRPYSLMSNILHTQVKEHVDTNHNLCYEGDKKEYMHQKKEMTAEVIRWKRWSREKGRELLLMAGRKVNRHTVNKIVREGHPEKVILKPGLKL